MLLHRTAYTRKVLKRFGMHNANSLAAPMIGRSHTLQDPYTPANKEEEEVDKAGYLAAVGALLYLATFTRPNISFAVSTLGRHSQKPTVRHWAGVKHLLRYLRGTEDLDLLYSRNGAAKFVGYADAGSLITSSFCFLSHSSEVHTLHHLLSYLNHQYNYENHCRLSKFISIVSVSVFCSL